MSSRNEPRWGRGLSSRNEPRTTERNGPSDSRSLHFRCGSRSVPGGDVHPVPSLSLTPVVVETFVWTPQYPGAGVSPRVPTGDYPNRVGPLGVSTEEGRRQTLGPRLGGEGLVEGVRGPRGSGTPPRSLGTAGLERRSLCPTDRPLVGVCGPGETPDRLGRTPAKVSAVATGVEGGGTDGRVSSATTGRVASTCRVPPLLHGPSSHTELFLETPQTPRSPVLPQRVLPYTVNSGLPSLVGPFPVSYRSVPAPSHSRGSAFLEQHKSLL